VIISGGRRQKGGMTVVVARTVPRGDVRCVVAGGGYQCAGAAWRGGRGGQRGPQSSVDRRRMAQSDGCVVVVCSRRMVGRVHNSGQ
jgi:hypothetical protein